MKLHIKYMVSQRCKTAVKTELEKLHIIYGVIDLGEVEIVGSLSKIQAEQLKLGLLKAGLELMDTKKAKIIEKIKTSIIEMVHYSNQPMMLNFSHYLADKLGYDYTYLATIFSQVTGFTIAHYVIAQKIELAKELLLYDELSLTEIAEKLNYSSVAHLSGQFKKVTGLTPTYFKKIKQFKRRIALEDL